jgi:hypothetical protein
MSKLVDKLTRKHVSPVWAVMMFLALSLIIAAVGVALAHKMRARSESFNRQVEDSLYRHHRAHSEVGSDSSATCLGSLG